jgi:hypothetical protein
MAAADLADSDHPKLTFYRITIKANSVNTTSSYQSGFYSATALHQLFGEVKQPTASSDSANLGTGSGEFQILLDPQTGLPSRVTQNDRFAVMYGANADAVAQQIQAFAEASDTGDQIGAVLAASIGAPLQQQLAIATQSAQAKQKAQTTLAQQLTALAGQLSAANQTPAQVKAILLQAAQYATTAAGSTITYSTAAADQDTSFQKAKVVYDTLNSSLPAATAAQGTGTGK